MKASAVKSNEENKSRSMGNSVAQKKSRRHQGFSFVDNRPEAKAQRSIQMIINDSPRTVIPHQQMKNISEMGTQKKKTKINAAVIQCAVPKTKIDWSQTKTLSDNDGNSSTFTFPEIMNADPLSPDPNGYAGSGPDGKADWWPYFQKRHKAGLYWVQGHMLNDNLYGPGKPYNLVPISGTTNTNMETKGERTAKDLVLKSGKVLHYKVQAHWDTSPADKRIVWGMTDDPKTPGLLWGEQFAPNYISWTIWEKKETSPNVWVDDKMIQAPENQWYNTFPKGQ